MASPASGFMKLATLQQRYVQISYKFHPGHTVNVEGMDVNTFTLVSKVWFAVRQLSQNSITSLPNFLHIIQKTFIIGQNFIHPLK